MIDAAAALTAIIWRTTSPRVDSTAAVKVDPCDGP
jgi:hypothetical protein